MSDSIDPDLLDEPRDQDEFEMDDRLPNVEVSQSSERDAVLAAVLREQTEKADSAAQAREIRIRRQGFGPRHVALTFSTLVSMWIWFWPPHVIRFDPPQPPPVAEEEATLRLVMYFQAQRIEQYLRDNGGIPVSLEEAGPVFQGMEYIRLTNRDYRILGRTGRVTLSYSSVEPLNTFVGAGASVLDVMTLN